MKRRNFIIGAAGLTAVTVPAFYYLSRDLQYDQNIAEPHLLSQILDTDTILNIGKSYCAKVEKENSERTLVNLLEKGIDIKGPDLPGSIANKIQHDYDQGKTVMIEGWVLSVTEARQCALLSLITKSK